MLKFRCNKGNNLLYIPLSSYKTISLCFLFFCVYVYLFVLQIKFENTVCLNALMHEYIWSYLLLYQIPVTVKNPPAFTHRQVNSTLFIPDQRPETEAGWLLPVLYRTGLTFDELGNPSKPGLDRPGPEFYL